MPKSLLDYAYEFMSNQKEQTKFQTMWAYICEQAGLSEEEANARVSRFYTNLMLDGRFVTLGENEWDLRVRHTFDKVHIDMKDVYADVEDSDDDVEDLDDEKEYNEAFKDEDVDSDENENDESNDEMENI